MGNLKEPIWYNNLDWSMIWVCIIAVVVHILYLEINKNPNKTNISFTWKNYTFYFLSSVLVLAFISEVGMPLVNQYFSISTDLQGSIDHFLSALSGLGGGYITTGLIKKFQK